MARWSMPDQTGRVAVVTGANSGLGYQSTVVLAEKGATVIMACRNRTLAARAVADARQAVPGARVEVAALDLGDLASVRAFAQDVQARYDRLDILLNNAGIMAIPRAETVDGFEMQFGVNHLGHYALTGLLLDLLVKTPGSRVVTTTSVAYLMGQIHFDDIQLRKHYTRYAAYGQSKLANLLFGVELQRRLHAGGTDVLSLVAHPGYANTSLQHNSTSRSGSLVERGIYGLGNRVFAQPAAMGALPQLYAATAADVRPGGLYGPRFLTRGAPAANWALPVMADERVARHLWNVSEELTGIRYPLGQPAAVAG